MAEQNTQPILTVSRGQADVLRKVGDIWLSFDETMDYTGFSRTDRNEPAERPRTPPPVRVRLAALARIMDARLINPLPKRGAA